MAGAALSLVCGAAEARPKAPPKPDPRDEEIQLLKAQVQALAAKVDGLEARAAAAAAQPPAPPPPPPAPVAIVQTPAAPPAAQPTTAVTLVAGKPSIQSADGRFTANLHGVMQFDAADYSQDKAGPITSDFRRGAAAGDTAHARDLSSGTNFRRARIGVDGKAFGDWEYNLLFEYGGAGEEDAAHIQELWAQYSGFRPFHIRVGAFAPSIGLEDQGSTNAALFLERPAVADMARSVAGGDFREAGEIWGGTDRWYVSAAVTGRTVGVIGSTGSAVSQPFDAALGFVGRAAFVPVKTDDLLVELGLHGSYVDRVSDAGGPDVAAGASRYPVTFQERPELRVDGTRLISTGAINARHASTLGVEASALFHSLFVQSEYEHFQIERLNPAIGVTDPDFEGWYIEGGWTITGEKRRFDPGVFAWTGSPVDHPFSPKDGTWGAFELTGRYSQADLNYHAGAAGAAPTADAVRGGDQQIWTVGLNWYPNTFYKLMFDYQNVRIRRLSPSATSFQTPTGAEIGQNYHVLMLRTQFAF
jgi:phosphate-selective porin OprO/OprP